MRTQKLTFMILLIAFFNFPQAAYAQTSSTTLLQEIQKAYNELNYTEAEIKARSALENYQDFTSSQLTEVHKTLALIYYSQNKPTESRRQFEVALSLNPELKLDPLFVSPKILEFYDLIKAEWQLSKQQNNDIQNEIRYVLVNDPRPSAALRSMILPGWGQVYKSEKR
ncbi:tetratricopeptide repeat protein, partial [candidate division KSB1 bacterium]|nr:tetratricopeptide repeat protein [candidate division KSB1 bacterium]